MNPVKKYTLAVLDMLAGGMPLPGLINISGKHLFLPFYHIVTDEYAPHIEHIYPVRNIALFKADLDYLLRHFTPIDAVQLSDIASGNKKLEKNSFFLSFDDGLREVHDIVAPILLEKGIPATFFINTGFIDNKDLFYRYKASLLVDFILKHEIHHWEKLNQVTGLTGRNTEALKKYILGIDCANKTSLDRVAEVLGFSFANWLAENKPYLTASQIKDLHDKGFGIGAHSIDHPLFSSIQFEEQCRQAEESIIQLQHDFRVPVKTFAFPFTDSGVSLKFFDFLLNGNPPVADLSFGTAGLKNDSHPHHWQRFPIEGTLKPAHKLVKAEYFYFILKSLAGKGTIKRK